MGKVIAITGKGGTGKTAVTAMLIRHLNNSEKKFRILAIDADPDANLADALGAKVEKTVGDMREFMQDSRFTSSPDTDKQALFEAKIFEILLEEDGYDLLVMGKPEGSGCYCYVNNLLRAIMDKTAKDYDLIVIDSPAGLEHFSRKIFPDLDDLIVVTDESRRGLTTGERIRDIAREMGLKYKDLYVVVNKITTGRRDKVIENATSLGLTVIGTIPYDESLAKFDLVGDPLTGLPDDSPAVKEMANVVGKLGL
ncbi:MAG TPA: AAA family ATPase [Methanothrix soehngenii]|uniref:Nucleotide binding domain protein n=3 Tax=root TaxID=1 RepID=F4C0K5_METSG|nr:MULTISPECIES: AAA family ATPase [Methanothrix]OPX76557.1 MAG: protochlorophyllide reductase iron-sulfur ATP-binding protein [Methanosaeta sp. PtaB.Bin005]AEB68016.1 nucleotide binding domain protein [Methanothrix soehngenii GP6]MBP7067424.1 AAA family ATPase [Methanothrix sp.]MDD3551925.1 AAA family ATPase [Methanothrix soehngenii]MDY0410940.1 AAA family ATPase [Methanothrix soehngenii]